MCSADALHIQQKLDETTKLLRDLQEAQKERLSAKQPPNMICLLAPSAKELELGENLDLARENNQSINQKLLVQTDSFSHVHTECVVNFFRVEIQ